MFISLRYDNLRIIFLTLAPVNIRSRIIPTLALVKIPPRIIPTLALVKIPPQIIPTLALVKIRSYQKKLDQYFFSYSSAE